MWDKNYQVTFLTQVSVAPPQTWPFIPLKELHLNLLSPIKSILVRISTLHPLHEKLLIMLKYLLVTTLLHRAAAQVAPNSQWSSTCETFHELTFSRPMWRNWLDGLHSLYSRIRLHSVGPRILSMLASSSSVWRRSPIR
jgi:hypothetical protein